MVDVLTHPKNPAFGLELKTKTFLAMIEDHEGTYHETEISFSFVDEGRSIDVKEYDSTVKFPTWQDSIEAMIEDRFGVPVSFWSARENSNN